MATKQTTSNLKLTATDRVSAKLKGISKNFTQLDKKVKKSSKNFAKFRKQTLLAGRSVRKFGKSTRKVGVAMSRNVSLPIVAVGAGILTMAARFEKSMNKVQAKSGATADQFKAMRNQAKILGRTTQFSASQAADGMSFLAQAGWDSSQILKGMPALLNLAASSEMELGRAADITSNIMGAFNIKAEDTGRVADVLAAATASSNVDMEQLGETMKKAAPIAATFGASLEDTAAAAGILGNVGIQGSDAGTAMKRAFLALSAPTSEASKMLNIMGIKTTDAKGNMLKFADIMGSLGGKLSGFPQSARLKVLNGLFGKIGIAGATMLQKAANNGSLQKMGKNLLNVEGAAKRMATTMNKGATGGITKLKSAAEGLAIEIGDSGLLDLFTKAVSKLTGWVSSMSEASKTTLKWAVIIGGALAVLGPIVAGIGGLITVLGALAPVLTVLGTLFGAVAAVVGGPVLLAIAAFAGAATLIFTYWQPISDFFSGLWDKIKGLGSSIATLAKGASLFKGLFGGSNEVKVNKTVTTKAAGGDLAGPVRNIQTKTNNNNQNVTLDFKNIPKGTKVVTEGSKSKGLNLNLGYQGAGAI